MFVTKGRMLQGMVIGLMEVSCELKLCGVSVSMIGVELSKVVRGIWLET